MTPEQQDKFEEFTAIREAVGKTTWLSSIFDETWFKEALPKIINSSLPGMVAADPSLFFHGLPPPLLDTAKFKAIIALLDRRLKAFAGLPFKRKEVKDKLEQLRKTRSNKEFLNHFFEINVLGDLTINGVLCDIEENTTKVDGVIDLAGRQIFIEATNTTQEVIPRLTETSQDICGSDDGLHDADGTEHDGICEGTRVMAIDTDCQIKQVVEKLRKKVYEGRQLALAKGSPTVLFLARTYYGADRLLAEITVNECFHAHEFAGLSGVVLADSWKFQNTSWHPSVKPSTPLNEVEERKLRGWYAKGNVDA